MIEAHREKKMANNNLLMEACGDSDLPWPADITRFMAPIYEASIGLAAIKNKQLNSVWLYDIGI